jgi:hypothetical protein
MGVGEGTLHNPSHHNWAPAFAGVQVALGAPPRTRSWYKAVAAGILPAPVASGRLDA